MILCISEKKDVALAKKGRYISDFFQGWVKTNQSPGLKLRLTCLKLNLEEIANTTLFLRVVT